MSRSTGYPVVFCPDHPRAWSTGYVYAHTIVAEAKLGRLLQPGEIVHHKNENRADYSPDNLEVTSRTAHGEHHAVYGGSTELACDECGEKFERTLRRVRHSQAKGVEHVFCSNKCKGTFARRNGWAPK